MVFGESQTGFKSHVAAYNFNYFVFAEIHKINFSIILESQFHGVQNLKIFYLVSNLRSHIYCISGFNNANVYKSSRFGLKRIISPA